MARRVLAAAAAALILAGTGGSALASPAEHRGAAIEEEVALCDVVRDLARAEDLRSRNATAAMARRRITETEQALAVWRVDRAGAIGP